MITFIELMVFSGLLRLAIAVKHTVKPPGVSLPLKIKSAETRMTPAKARPAIE